MQASQSRLSCRILSAAHVRASLSPSVHHVSNVPSRSLSLSLPCRSKLQVGDRVILRWKQGKSIKTKLTKPLRLDGETIVENIKLGHQDLIGRDSNVALLKSSKDGLRKFNVIARHPTLDEFTSLAPRRVAPIYASYASTIVSLLDIHPEPPSLENDPTKSRGPSLQILEAGTGHGGLTVQLARAIAASNPPVTPEIMPTPSEKCIYKHGEECDDDVVPVESQSSTLQLWKSNRRAVVHTVDIDHENRLHADKLLRSYRGGMYWPHVNFNSGDVKDWLSEKMSTSSGSPFLDMVFLDMPGVESYISTVVSAMKRDAQLLVFVPQITQIAACVQQIVGKNLGLNLEKVVELGDGVSSGRMWDVRMASVKNAQSVNRSRAYTPTEPSITTDVSRPAEPENAIPPMVCRPIVGEMTRGGGFIGLWKRVGTREEAQ